MILQALDDIGGVAYLARVAEGQPSAFMSLLGRVLPTQLEHAGPGGGAITVITGVPEPKSDG